MITSTTETEQNEMNKKKGKGYFYWLGQLHFNRGDEILYLEYHGKNWPNWAKSAYMRAIT